LNILANFRKSKMVFNVKYDLYKLYKYQANIFE